MASNPVFNRIDDQLKRRGYAGFRQVGQPTGPGGPASPARPAGAQQRTMSADQLETLYQQPAAGRTQMGRVTLDDVVMKTLGLFTLVLALAAASWYAVELKPALALPLWGIGMLAGLAVGLVIAFKKTISVPLILGYAALEGVFVGSISKVFETAWDGVVGQAVVATLVTFVGMFIGWKVGFVKVTSRTRRIFGMAIMGYLLFGIVNLVAAWGFGTGNGWGIVGTQFGWIICLVGIALAAYSLAIDFDTVDRAVALEVPQKYSWLLAHGLIVSLVWLYIEFLRMFALRRD